MPSVVTLTLNPTVDKETRIDHVEPEHKLRCAAPTREPGGGGLNVARAVQRLGGEALTLYLAGGPTGEILRGLLDAEGLPHRPLPIKGWTRENLIVYEEASTLQYRFGMPGPEVQEAEGEQCLEALRAFDPAPRYLVASGSLPPGLPADFYRRVAAVAAERGTRVVVDTSGEALRQAVEVGVFLLKPNLRELQQLAEAPLHSEPEQEAAARRLIAAGRCEAVLLSLGAGGAFLITASACTHIRTPTVPIRSKVGAGDSMVAGVVLALTRGLPLPNAARFGVAAGAAAVMTPGTELCRRDDTERLYTQIAEPSAE